MKKYPALDVIIDAALVFKAQHKRLPKAEDRNACLPEDSPGWGSIIPGYLRAKQQTTLSKLISEREGYAIGKNGHKLNIMPSDDDIARAAVQHLKEKGKWPVSKPTAEFLPQDSLSWRVVLERMKDRGLSMAALIEQKQPAFADVKNKDPYNLPDNQTIVDAAILFIKKFNRIPSTTSKRKFLPPDSYGWAVVINALPKERNKTIRQLIAAHLAKHPDPDISLQIRRACRGERPKRHINAPADRKNNFIADADIARYATDFYNNRHRLPSWYDGKASLPSGKTSWNTIISTLERKGKTIGDLVTHFSQAQVTETPKTDHATALLLRVKPGIPSKKPA